MVTNSPIIQFYSKISPDSEGRMIDFIWKQDYTWLERTHDYIQWLFPLTEKSLFNPKSPILTEVDIRTFIESKNLKLNLLISLKVMLSFYGLKLEQKPESSIIIDPNLFIERKKQWLHWGNHNHLRITRILKSLNLLGLEKYANLFFSCLEHIYATEKDNITRLTFSYWTDAVKITN